MEHFIGVKNEESIKQYQNWEMDEEIQVFREYLRYPTVHPNVDYGENFPEVQIEFFFFNGRKRRNTLKFTDLLLVGFGAQLTHNSIKIAHS